jgi:hypothetical protein
MMVERVGECGIRNSSWIVRPEGRCDMSEEEKVLPTFSNAEFVLLPCKNGT